MKFLWVVTLGYVASQSVVINLRKERSKHIFNMVDSDKSGSLTAIEARDHMFKQKGGQEFASYMDVGNMYAVLSPPGLTVVSLHRVHRASSRGWTPTKTRSSRLTSTSPASWTVEAPSSAASHWRGFGNRRRRRLRSGATTNVLYLLWSRNTQYTRLLRGSLAHLHLLRVASS